MTYKEISEMIVSIGLPCSFYQFPDNTPQTPPFICWVYPNDNDFLADNTNYQKIERVQLELYTVTKSISQETAVESVLASNGIVWTREDGFLDDEQLHMTVWRFDVVIDPDEVNENEQN